MRSKARAQKTEKHRAENGRRKTSGTGKKQDAKPSVARCGIRRHRASHAPTMNERDDSEERDIVEDGGDTRDRRGIRKRENACKRRIHDPDAREQACQSHGRHSYDTPRATRPLHAPPINAMVCIALIIPVETDDLSVIIPTPSGNITHIWVYRPHLRRPTFMDAGAWRCQRIHDSTRRGSNGKRT